MIPPYVLGLDPSLTGTGVAWVRQGTAVCGSHTLASKGHRDATITERAARLYALTVDFHSVLAALDGECILAVVEGPSLGSAGGSSWDRAGLWWKFVEMVISGGVPVALCAPATRIKWATGSGRATPSTKTDVGVAVSRLWPESVITGDDQYDAVAMATMGAQHLGWDVPRRAHHEAALKGVKWPVTALEAVKP